MDFVLPHTTAQLPLPLLMNHRLCFFTLPEVWRLSFFFSDFVAYLKPTSPGPAAKAGALNAPVKKAIVSSKENSVRSSEPDLSRVRRSALVMSLGKNR